jgi:hypothetical protein
MFLKNRKSNYRQSSLAEGELELGLPSIGKSPNGLSQGRTSMNG